MKIQAFTLIELLVVIVIVGTLAALAIPKFTHASAKAKASEVPTVMAQISKAEFTQHMETNAFVNIAYATWQKDLNQLLGIDITPAFFSYYTTNATDIAFVAHAQVEKGFGSATVGAEARMDQLDQVTFHNDVSGYLSIYLKAWASH